MALEWIRFCVTAILLLVGLFVLAVGVIGTYRFHFVLNRMHAAAMGDTLGLLFSLVALAVSGTDLFMSLKYLLVIAFLWVASPVGSHLISRLEVTTNEDLGRELEVRKL